ncbi:glycosyltransferase [Mucilaginibacter sp. UR6-11]|uniref:glycosyltransferase n=1 Tax=Mucilaginibacter sp. UR6-11 TaxID=1435644 RepID=UPI001E2B2163|nr:glycosyltransferase [Mucilaginibacter sp. UR6-11]MCC8426370.1 glycosyltransferase [Mucilaginibacter sp. UR6-11]
MKKKVFMIVASLGAGGSERVFWLLSQYFNNAQYSVSVVVLNSDEHFFCTDVQGIRFLNLKTVKASRSFFKLYRVLRDENPFAVFSTADHVNILTGIVAFFLKIPHLVARASNNPQQMRRYYGAKMKFYNFFTRLFFCRFDFVVCQSDEMQQAMATAYGISAKKLKVIANPVLTNVLVKNERNFNREKKLIGVGRLAKEKGWFRLLDTIKRLPVNYKLTIVGDGPLMGPLKQYAAKNGLEQRTTFLGEITNVASELIKHDVMVHCSYTEGFPNVVLEALSVGVPVVAFRVGGLNELIRDGFNGFVVEQGHDTQLCTCIEKACNQAWLHDDIKEDINSRFSLELIGRAYESLLTQ